MTSGFAQGGFEDRFTVTRKDGKPIRPEARYLVLDYSGSDPHATAAIKTYADSIRADNAQMADDLTDALVNPAAYPAQHD